MCDHVCNSHDHSVLQALILQGEIWCWSLLGLKGLTDQIRAQSKDFSAGSQADLNRGLVLPVVQAS